MCPDNYVLIAWQDNWKDWNYLSNCLFWRFVLIFSRLDEALWRQEEIWQQEVEESLSLSRSLFHPSRPKHVEFLRITAPDDDITDTPATTPLPRELRVSRVKKTSIITTLSCKSCKVQTVTACSIQCHKDDCVPCGCTTEGISCMCVGALYEQ